MIDKIAQTVDQALSGIRDGSMELIGGFGTAGIPNEIIDSLIEQDARELTVVNNNAGNGDHGQAALLKSGQVRKIICSFPRQADSHVFDSLYRDQRIELELVPQGNLAERPRAARAGIGAFFTPTCYGTELAKHADRSPKETRVINGRPSVLEYPIHGDVALEITPVVVPQKRGVPVTVDRDGHPRETSLDTLAKLKGVVQPDGTVTAGNSSGVNDGACALLLVSEQAAVRYRLTPRVRVVGMAAAGAPPRIMDIGPAPSTRKVLELTGLSLEQLDVIELNDVFAAQGLAVLRDLTSWQPERRSHRPGPSVGRQRSTVGDNRGQPTACKRRPLCAVHDVHRRWPGNYLDPGTGASSDFSFFGQK